MHDGRKIVYTVSSVSECYKKIKYEGIITNGRLAEWLIALVLKTREGNTSVGSNPIPSFMLILTLLRDT